MLAFAEIGWKVNVLTRKTYELDSSVLKNKGIQQYIIPRPPGSQITYGILSLAFPLYFKKIIQEVKPDLIHVHSILYAMISAFSEFHPKIVTVWGYHHIMKSWPAKRWLERRSLRSADIITVNSPSLAEKICEIYGISPEKVVFLFWGVDLSTFKKGYEDETGKLRRALNLEWVETVILSPRAATPHYNLDVIVKAFAKLKENKDIALIILKGTGKDEYLRDIENLVKKLGIHSRVRIIEEFLSEREMAALFNLSDVFVSIPNTDQIAFTVVEGMACGSVPIISDLPDYDGIIEHGVSGFRVKPRDVNSLTKIMRLIVGNKSLREAISSKNMDFVKEFADRDKNLKRMLKLYECLIQTERRRSQYIMRFKKLCKE